MKFWKRPPSSANVTLASFDWKKKKKALTGDPESLFDATRPCLRDSGLIQSQSGLEVSRICASSRGFFATSKNDIRDLHGALKSEWWWDESDNPRDAGVITPRVTEPVFCHSWDFHKILTAPPVFVCCDHFPLLIVQNTWQAQAPQSGLSKQQHGHLRVLMAVC